ncbi:MAG TPA: sensor histidine kinase [Bryobacteraceae bacterium]|nr:sensor histidine kinase [Bryobacteraceae bacterium]
MPSRTWPVFLLGLSTLLLLICVPGMLLLSRTQRSYAEIQAVQQQYEEGLRTLDTISARITEGSLLVREFLLDTSPVNAASYRKRFEANRVETIAALKRLRRTLEPQDYGPFENLSSGLDQHAADVLPVFDWSPTERREKATYFLRQQQRLRRDSLLAATGHLARLHASNYERQQQLLEASRLRFRNDLKYAVLIAFLLGLGVAAATVVRIYMLEHQSARQQAATEQARRELENLSHELMRAQESERKSLSRELHDQVGQTLTALRMELGAIERLRQGEAARFSQHLDEAKSLAERTLRSVRDIAAGLRPSLLDDIGLGAAVEFEAREFTRRTGTPVDLQTAGTFEHLPDGHRICLFRVIQEALTNCTRHAQASRVGISLHESDEGIQLTIEDDGDGCDPLVLRKGGIGLRGMQERVRELNGSVSIQTAPGRGLQLHVELPLARPEVTA